MHCGNEVNYQLSFFFTEYSKQRLSLPSLLRSSEGFYLYSFIVTVVFSRVLPAFANCLCCQFCEQCCLLLSRTVMADFNGPIFIRVFLFAFSLFVFSYSMNRPTESNAERERERERERESNIEGFKKGMQSAFLTTWFLGLMSYKPSSVIHT